MSSNDPDGVGVVYVSGAIPPGPITDDTEMVFVAGRTFVNAAKHEEAVGRIAADRDALKLSVAMLRENAVEVGGLVAELEAAQRDRDALLEAIGHVSGFRGRAGRLAERLAELHATANEIAKRVGYAG